MTSYKSDKLKSLFETKDYSNCTFVFTDGAKIKAHKLILTLSSPVFERMFYGDMASDQILIEDICAATFDKMLRYIYTDLIEVDDVSDAWCIFYASQKYFLIELQDRCMHYIKTNLSISNLLACYEYAALYGEKSLARKCLDDIRAFSDAILLVDQEHHPQADTVQAIIAEGASSSLSLTLLTINWAMDELHHARNNNNGNLALGDNELGAATVATTTLANLIGTLEKHNLPVPKCNLAIDPQMEKALLYARHTDGAALVHLYRQLNEHTMVLRNDDVPMQIRVGADESRKMAKMKFRVVYKNCHRLAIRERSEVLSPNIYATSDCFLFGVTVTTKSKPANSGSEETYIGGANIYLYLRSSEREGNLIFKHQNQRNFLQYDNEQTVLFKVPVLLKAFVSYMLCIEYLAEDGRRADDSVLLTYMSDKVYAESNGNHGNSSNSSGKSSKSTCLCIEGETSGSVLKGLCFYEA